MLRTARLLDMHFMRGPGEESEKWPRRDVYRLKRRQLWRSKRRRMYIRTKWRLVRVSKGLLRETSCWRISHVALAVFMVLLIPTASLMFLPTFTPLQFAVTGAVVGRFVAARNWVTMAGYAQLVPAVPAF
jgi:hypothetical protein